MSWRSRVCYVLLLLLWLATGMVIWADYHERASPWGQLTSSDALTLEGAMAIAEQVDRYADRLAAPPMPRDDASLHALTVETLPYYVYEGVVSQVIIPTLSYEAFLDEAHFHLLGYYSRLWDLVALNARFTNFWSSRWYSSGYRFFSTLVHELAHAQGVVGWKDTEPATQIVTLEVLASMVRDGNIYALPTFLCTLAEYAGDYAWSQALQQDRLEEYEAHVRRVADTEYEVAAYYRSRDHWAKYPGELERILRDYGEAPYRILIEALANPKYKTRVLYPLPNREHRLCLDDTAWVIQHLDALVRDYNKLVESYEVATGE